MEKITIKELSPYLPYELKISTQYVGGRFNNPITLNPGVLTSVLRCGDRIKVTPYLRPLSSLTEEIEHNGERFVPLVELFKLSRGAYQMNIEKAYIEIVSSHQIQVELGHRLYFFGLYNSYCDERIEDRCDFKCYSTNLIIEDKQPEEVVCALYMYKKLYEWHFDINYLIPRGLAIALTPENSH